jgi:hypothetical protein
MSEEKREVCECKNCGNEAEMVITCTLPDEADADLTNTSDERKTVSSQEMKKKQTISCTHCGNEAEMWLDE